LPPDVAEEEAKNGVAADALALVVPPPKLNAPAPPAVEDDTALLAALEALVANPEVKDKAFDADLDVVDVDVPPKVETPNPENGRDDGVILLLLLLSPPLVDGAGVDPVEGSADMNDEPNILLCFRVQH
jgi:hypothetical protein